MDVFLFHYINFKSTLERYHLKTFPYCCDNLFAILSTAEQKLENLEGNKKLLSSLMKLKIRHEKVSPFTKKVKWIFCFPCKHFKCNEYVLKVGILVPNYWVWRRITNIFCYGHFTPHVFILRNNVVNFSTVHALYIYI